MSSTSFLNKFQGVRIFLLYPKIVIPRIYLAVPVVVILLLLISHISHYIDMKKLLTIHLSMTRYLCKSKLCFNPRLIFISCQPILKIDRGKTQLNLVYTKLYFAYLLGHVLYFRIKISACCKTILIYASCYNPFSGLVVEITKVKKSIGLEMD